MVTQRRERYFIILFSGCLAVCVFLSLYWNENETTKSQTKNEKNEIKFADDDTPEGSKIEI